MLRLFPCVFFLAVSLEVSLSVGLLGDLLHSEEYRKEAAKEFEVAKHAEQGEKGEKGYLSQHAAEQGEKGHHDKERHQKEVAVEGKSKKLNHCVALYFITFSM